MNKIKNKEVIIGIIGLGYVGLPIVKTILDSGFQVIGFDVDMDKVKRINMGESYIKHISSDFIEKFVNSSKLKATFDFSEIKKIL